MKRFLIAFFLFASVFFINAQEAHKVNDWENPQFFEQNKEQSNATMFPFTSKEAAIKNDRENSPRFHSLNGK